MADDYFVKTKNSKLLSNKYSLKRLRNNKVSEMRALSQDKKVNISRNKFLLLGYT